MRVFFDGEWICHNTWPQRGLKLPVKVVRLSGELLLDLTEDDLVWPDRNHKLDASDVFWLIAPVLRIQGLGIQGLGLESHLVCSCTSGP